MLKIIAAGRLAFSCVFLILIAAAITACSGGSGGSGSTPAPRTLTAISISPAAPSIAAGLSQQLSAKGSYSDSSTSDITSSVAWTSATVGIAAINNAGLATSKAVGTSLITATSGSTNGSVTITVTAAVLASIRITPAQSSVAAGLTQQFAATGTYSDGSTKDIGATVVWSSGTSSIATIGATGLASAKAMGTSLITATSGAISGSAPFTVSAASLVSIALTPPSPSVAAGLTQQMAALGTYIDNTSGDISNSVTWTSASPAIATVSASGLITTKSQGSALIQASFGSVSGSTALNVLPPRLVSIAVSPANATIQIGATTPQQFAVTGTYTDQSTKDISGSSAFAVTNPWVANITGTGAATPLRAGFTAVTTTNTSLTSTANFTVLATPRFLYVSSDAGRDLTRMAVNPQTGQPRFLGYQKTGNYSSVGPGCFTSEPTGSFAYLSSPISSSAGVVYTYRIDGPTGQLTPWGSNPLHVASPLGCIEFEPSGKFAYAAGGLNSGNEVLTFSADGNGRLTQIGSINLSNSSGGLAIDPLGKFLYVAAEDVLANGAGAAHGYSIDSATGALSPIPGTPFPLPQGGYGYFSFHPSGNYVYFANSSTTSISEFTIDRTTGQLTPVASGTVDPCINPAALMFSPDGSQAYVRCGEDNNRSVLNAPIVSFLVGSGGQLSQAGTAIVGPASWNMAVDPSGKFVYVVGSGVDVSQVNGGISVAANSVMVYQTAPDGKITLVNQIAGRVQAGGLILTGGASPVKLTPLHAYVSSSGDSKLTSYTVSADGSLVSLQSIPTTAPPVSATTLPWGSDLLVASQANKLPLSAYSINNGILAKGMSFGLAIQQQGLVIDPSGTIAFGADSSTGLVYEYAYGNLPGFWSGVYTDPALSNPLTYPAQAGAGPIITDPGGRYVIVANQTAKSISIFEPAGAAPTSPVPLTYTPIAIAMDPTGNSLFISGDDQKLHLLVSNGLGQFTDSAGAFLPGNSASLAIEPKGRFIYAAGSAGLGALSLDGATHALTSISLNLPVSLANATGVYIDPSGQFLYVAVTNNGVTALYLFNINADGTLTSAGPTPVALLNYATSMVFDAQIR